MNEINTLVKNKLQDILHCSVSYDNNTFQDARGLFVITSNQDGSYTVKEKESSQIDTYKDVFDLFINLLSLKFAITYGRKYNSANLDLKNGCKNLDFDVDWIYKRVSWPQHLTNYQMSVKFVTKKDMDTYINNLGIKEYTTTFKDFC